MKKIKKDNIQTVAVHVRRGDKLSSSAKRHGYQIPGKEDILFAMKYMRKKYHDSTLFVICSDDKVNRKKYHLIPIVVFCQV